MFILQWVLPKKTSNGQLNRQEWLHPKLVQCKGKIELNSIQMRQERIRNMVQLIKLLVFTFMNYCRINQAYYSKCQQCQHTESRNGRLQSSRPLSTILWVWDQSELPEGLSQKENKQKLNTPKPKPHYPLPPPQKTDWVFLVLDELVEYYLRVSRGSGWK